jgi:DNA polymerase elongation subunit (family B)
LRPAIKKNASRFYGVFTDGNMKIRGLACRHRDTPQFIRETQEEMLRLLAQAQNFEELHNLRKEAVKMLESYFAEFESRDRSKTIDRRAGVEPRG